MKHLIKLTALVMFFGFAAPEIQAAEDPAAMHDMGMQYYKGMKGAAPDLKKAIELWQQSAAAGYPAAQFDLGVLYKMGQVDGAPNPQKAVELWEKSVAAGYGPAMVNLGIAYAQGDGVGPDLNRALSLMQQAVQAYKNPKAAYPDVDVVLGRLNDMIAQIKGALAQTEAKAK